MNNRSKADGTKVTSEWICQCERKNPLRAKKCQACGRKIPQNILEQIYREEIGIQKGFFRKLRFQNSVKRGKKIGSGMNRLQKGIMPATICLLILCVGCQGYFASENFGENTREYADIRGQRIITEVAESGEHLSGIREIPTVITSVALNAWPKTLDVVTEIWKVKNHLNKKWQQEKIEDMEQKIEEGITNVTKLING